MKKILITIIASLALVQTAHATSIINYTGGGTGLSTIGASSTVLTTDGTVLKYNKLSPGNFTTANISQWTNNSGYLTSATLPFSYPFPEGATSSIVTFNNGLVAGASTTINAAFRLPSLAQGLLYTGTGGLISPTATGTLTGSGPITVTAGNSVIGAGATIACTTCNTSNATVSSVGTNNGLTGGTITTTGTIGLDITGVSTNASLSWSGSILTATGTVSLSAHHFIATTTTASILPYASTTGITSTGASNFATSGGNVGIGKTDPGFKLQVIASGASEVAIGDNSGTTGRGLLYMYNAGGTLTNRVDTNGDSYLTGGKLGIGTTSPLTTLHTTGTNGGGFQSTNAITLQRTNATNPSGRIEFLGTGGQTGDKWGIMTDTGAANAFVIQYKTAGNAFSDDFGFFGITTGGNVLVRSGSLGIGSTTPSKTLSVQGDALISGNITSVANITATGTVTFSGTGTTTSITGNATIGNLAITGQANGCLYAGASGYITSTGSGCGGSVVTTFFSTTSLQNLATTTLSGLSGGNYYDITVTASTTSGEKNYISYRVCFNACSVNDIYQVYGQRMTGAASPVSINDTQPGGAIITNNATQLDTAPAGGDIYTTRCWIDNNATSIYKNGQCTMTVYSGRAATAAYTSNVGFQLKQASAAAITSVSFAMFGDGDAASSGWATWATSTKMTAKAQ